MLCNITVTVLRKVFDKLGVQLGSHKLTIWASLTRALYLFLFFVNKTKSGIYNYSNNEIHSYNCIPAPATTFHSWDKNVKTIHQTHFPERKVWSGDETTITIKEENRRTRIHT